MGITYPRAFVRYARPGNPQKRHRGEHRREPSSLIPRHRMRPQPAYGKIALHEWQPSCPERTAEPRLKEELLVQLCEALIQPRVEQCVT